MKIPEHAKRVFKGILFDVYHWEQELFDGSTATFEALKRADSAMVLPMQGETAFYAKQEQPAKPPYLSLFGGNVNDGETPLEAAKRELLEETGMKSDNWMLLDVYTIPGKIDWNINMFIARNCRRVAEQKLDAGEKIEVCSCHIDEFLTKIATDDNFCELEFRAEIVKEPSLSSVEKIKKRILG